jgi:hypothetical protein
MPHPLTTNAIIKCPHGGPGTTIPSLPKWQIDGGYVCVEQDTGTIVCPQLNNPCPGYTLQSMGLNATKIDGRKVILVTDFNRTLNGLPLDIQDNNNVQDESTPAAIPAGQQAPPPSEEMADLVKPIVIAAPPSFPFKLPPPPPPAPVLITFMLTAQHPSQWILTLIPVPPAPSTAKFDLTDGISGAVTVVPSGGQWTTPSLTVTVTLLQPFVIGLGPGNHELYLTGVSKRGLSGHGKATIVVS